jgi:hypothetical protein
MAGVLALTVVLAFASLTMVAVQVRYMANRKRSLARMVKLAQRTRRAAARYDARNASVDIEFPTSKNSVRPRKAHESVASWSSPIDIVLRSALGGEASRQTRTTLHIEREADSSGYGWYRHGDGPLHNWIFTAETLTGSPITLEDVLQERQTDWPVRVSV